MSNYLQRLASSALKRMGSIHPVVNSLFSAPKADARNGSPWTEEDALVTKTPVPAHPVAPWTPPHSPVGTDEAPLGETSHQAHETVARERKPTNAPPEAGFRPAASPTGGANSDLPPQHVVPLPGGAAAQLKPLNIESQPAKAKSMEKSGRSYHPLVEGPFVSQEPNWISPGQPMSPGSFGRNGKAPAPTISRPSDESTREPDEIQIHIGRIEVTAVQAAAPTAPAPKPRRHSPSLDEYLKRRDRRVA